MPLEAVAGPLLASTAPAMAGHATVAAVLEHNHCPLLLLATGMADGYGGSGAGTASKARDSTGRTSGGRVLRL